MSLDQLEGFTPDVVEEPILRPPTEPSVKTRQSSREQKTSWYHRPLRLLLVIIIAAALITGGVVWWLQARQWESTDDAFIDVHMVMIAPQVAGSVSRVLVDDNQKVTAGQLLVKLDPAIFQAQLDQAAVNREAAAGSLAQANAQQAVGLANAQEARAKSVSPRPMRQMRRASCNARSLSSSGNSRRASSSTMISRMRAAPPPILMRPRKNSPLPKRSYEQRPVRSRWPRPI